MRIVVLVKQLREDDVLQAQAVQEVLHELPRRVCVCRFLGTPDLLQEQRLQRGGGEEVDQADFLHDLVNGEGHVELLGLLKLLEVNGDDSHAVGEVLNIFLGGVAVVEVVQVRKSREEAVCFLVSVCNNETALTSSLNLNLVNDRASAVNCLLNEVLVHLKGVSRGPLQEVLAADLLNVSLHGVSRAVRGELAVLNEVAPKVDFLALVRHTTRAVCFDTVKVAAMLVKVVAVNLLFNLGTSLNRETRRGISQKDGTIFSLVFKADLELLLATSEGEDLGSVCGHNKLGNGFDRLIQEENVLNAKSIVEP
eukprot:Colp12_sorted_trinity150504_noHs@14268